MTERNNVIGINYGQEAFQLRKDNFVETIKKIESRLSSGTPVLVHNSEYSQNSFVGKRTRRTLFFSDGTINENGTFNIAQGKGGFVCARVGETDEGYDVSYNSEKPINNGPKLIIPTRWRKTGYNEGTHSFSGGESFLELHKKGTVEVVIGETLEKKYPNAINSLKFVQDSIFVSIPHEYTTPKAGPMSFEGEDTIGEGKAKKEEREKQFEKTFMANATMNLLKQSLNKFESPVGDLGLKMTEVGYYRSGVEIYRKEGYPVNADDLEIEEIMHPHRLIGFLKVTRGGEGFFLPNNLMPEGVQKNESLAVDLAFSDEVIKEIYPGIPCSWNS